MNIDSTNLYLQNCNKIKPNTTKMYVESNNLETNKSNTKYIVKDTVEITHTPSSDDLNSSKPALYEVSGFKFK